MDTKLISTPFKNGQLNASGTNQVQRVNNPVVAETQTRSVDTTEQAERPRPESVNSAEQVEKIVSKLNSQALASNHTLRFTVNEESGKAVISVVDRETDEVIRQIPPESALKIAEAFAAVTSGSLLSESA